MKVVILAGGLGLRLSEHTDRCPKPMVPIGEHPMLWHIMQVYAAHEIEEFVIALGYKQEVIKDYFTKFTQRGSDLSIDLATGECEVHASRTPDWKVHLVDTGERTMTGGRLKRLRKWIGNETFMMTYGDGLADIDIYELLTFHRRHGKLATMTAVRPPARFGCLHLDGQSVVRFDEKPQADEGWINGGFFVLEPEVLEYISGDEVMWERVPLEKLAADGELMAYQHGGFWQPMDTLREQRKLEAMWKKGEAPWMMVKQY
ncbi:MAG: glucose-1-phosphate cytidylyltransferase [Simkaniaceae bacterium]|nr:glucose-1-phosphate cytidylyltransferase [Simkaniaceae bacterium]